MSVILNTKSGEGGEDSVILMAPSSRSKNGWRSQISGIICGSLWWIGAAGVFLLLILILGVVAHNSSAISQRYSKCESQVHSLMMDRDTLRDERDQLKTNSSNLTKEMKELQSQDNGLQSQDNGLQSQNNGLQVRYTELQSQNNGLQGRYTELQSQNNGLQVRYTELQSQNNGLQGRYTELQSQNDGLQGRYTELQSRYTELQSRYTELQSQNDGLQSRYTELQSQNDGLQGRYTELQSQNNGLQSRYTELQSQNNGLQSRYTELQSQNDGLQGRYTELQSQNDGLQGRYTELQSQNNGLQSRYTELQSQNNGLQGRYTELQSQNSMLQSRYNATAESRDQLQEEVNRLNVNKADKTCFEGWKTFGDKCYFFSADGVTKTWESSRKDCKERGADLAMITSKEELNFVSTLYGVTWIGLSDKEQENKWKWVDGSELAGDDYWQDGEPNNTGGNEDCAEVSRSLKRFNDEPCERNFSWACEAESRDQLQEEVNRLNVNKADKTCFEGWKTFGDKCYFFSADGVTKTWESSRKDCKERGADLAMITSKEELNFVSTLYDVTWIGLSDKEQENKWKWVDGSELAGDDYWQDGEPNNTGGNEDCAEVSRSEKRFNDVPCELKFSWACEV